MAKITFNEQIIKDIELFVFDKDGTLIDLYNYWYTMIELRAKKICMFYRLDENMHKENLMFDMGIDCARCRLKPEGPVGILPRSSVQKAAEDYLVKQGYTDASLVCYRIFKEVDQESLPLFDRLIKPVNGAIELLRQIKSNGSYSAIATNDKTERGWLAIEFLKIDKLIDFVVGSDKVSNSKPAPDMLNLIVKEMNIAPAKAVMIGDAETDIQMGINAQFKASIAVCSGITAREVLNRYTSYVVDDISQIKVS